MNHRLKRTRRTARRGVALVEFALVAPVFLMMVVGAVELGRAIMVQEALTNASREGARLGIVDGTLTADVGSAVQDYLAGMSITGASTSVTPSNPGLTADGTQVTVAVSIPYASISWVPSPWFLKNTTLAATSVMQRDTVE